MTTTLTTALISCGRFETPWKSERSRQKSYPQLFAEEGLPPHEINYGCIDERPYISPTRKSIGRAILFKLSKILFEMEYCMLARRQ